MSQTMHDGRVPKLHVFLSYRSVEARIADALKQHLVRDFIGLVDVFLASDTTSIPAGASWHAEVLGGLRRSELHIVLCSAASVQCPWIHYEAGAAAVRSTPIVPLCHSGLLPHQLPVPLSESEGIVITDADSLRKLYARVAGLIGSGIPAADFAGYAREFRELEQHLGSEHAATEAAAGAATGTELIENARVLCVTSPQFQGLGYANQLEVVLGAFPETISHEFVLSSRDLVRTLSEQRVDIVHIAAFVCPRAGDLYFTPVDLPLGSSAVPDPDVMRPEALVRLLREAKTQLVVLGASASLVLGAQLLPVANVIAVRDMVSARAMASWIDTFYQTLMTKPLAAAFDLATQVSQAPMKLYAKQRTSQEFTLRLAQAPVAAQRG